MWNKFKVVELASVLAGPSVGSFFAELGANVIKFENKRTDGDMTRKWKLASEKDESVSAYFSSINYGKTYKKIDLSNLSDRKEVEDEIRDAHIVLSNFKPGSAQKLKMDFESLKKLNSKIIYGEITGFSETSDRPAFDVVLQAETGWMSMNGNPGSIPVKMPVALIDILAAHQLKEGILTALLQQVETQKAYKVSVSLFDSAIASLANQASNYLMNDHIPKQMGSAHPNIAPYGDLFKTKDEKNIVLAVGTEQHFESLVSLLGIDENEKFSSNVNRVNNRNDLVNALQSKIGEWTCSELIHRLYELGIPVGQVKNLKEVFESDSVNYLILEEEIENRMTRKVKSKVFSIST